MKISLVELRDAVRVAGIPGSHKFFADDRADISLVERPPAIRIAAKGNKFKARSVPMSTVVSYEIADEQGDPVEAKKAGR